MTKAELEEKVADLEEVIVRMKKEAEGWSRHNLSPAQERSVSAAHDEYLRKHEPGGIYYRGDAVPRKG